MSDNPGIGMLRHPYWIFVLSLLTYAMMIEHADLLFTRPLHALPFLGLGVFTLLRPQWTWIGLLAALLAFVSFSGQFPRMANHANLGLFVCTAVLGVAALRLFNPRFRLTPTQVSHAVVALTASCYFYTGFHKLNHDFLDPQVSCTRAFTSGMLEYSLGMAGLASPRWLLLVTAYGTLFLELIVPFGLLFSRTRKVATVLFLAFHAYLSLGDLADFAAFAVFLHVACLGTQCRLDHPDMGRALRHYGGFCLATLAAQVLARYGLGWSEPRSNFVRGIVFDIGLIGFWLTFFRHYSPRSYRTIRHRWALPVLVVLAVSAWSLKAYVGLGNSGNLTMFSNLRTLKGEGNHLLVDTRKTKLFGFEEDYVTVLATGNRRLDSIYADTRIPLVEFNYRASFWTKKPLRFELVYRGDTLRTATLKGTRFEKGEWWHKYLFFRPVAVSEKQPCRW